MKLLRWFLRRQVRLVATLFLPFGIAMIVLGLILYCNERRFVHSAQHATGKIIAMESRDESFYPRFTFSLSDEIASNVGTNPPDFEVGQQVPVVYEARNPRTAKIATTFQIYGFSIVVEIVGMVFIAFGFFSSIPETKILPSLEVDVHSYRFDQHGAAVSVVAGVVDGLQVEGVVDAAPGVQVVVAFDDVFAAVG